MTIDDRSSLFHLENAAPMYLKEGEAKPGQQGQGIQVTATIDADFFVLVGILFNAVTGKVVHCATKHDPLVIGLTNFPCLLTPRRDSDGLQQVWGPEGCAEVHSCGNHSGHTDDINVVYPCHHILHFSHPPLWHPWVHPSFHPHPTHLH